ncbi:MAG: YraN family protein [Gemmatimonadetes bacterium]|nr:YraN family protein [Gemmatimonadota bacterium]
MPIRSDPDQWTDPRHVRGLQGEEAAMEYLRQAGWTILAHRFRMGRLEIDLVARKGPLVAFVEVKTRFNQAFGSPLHAVTWSKQREIGRVAQAWVDRRGRPGETYRFDVIGVTRLSGGRNRIEHVADAFRLAGS